MASTGPRGSMDTGTRRFISIVVVAMLLLVVLLSALMLLPTPEGDGEGDGDGDDPTWRIEDDTIRVFEDTKWSEWDTVLEWPVFIEPGVTLTVEDSYLEIPLERMVFEEWPVFNLEFDSDLVFTNSTLRVDADPQLETALFDSYRGEISTPILSRVVNLVDAEEPVLEMEVEKGPGEAYVVVSVQTAPNEPLEPLAVIEPDELTLYEWSTVMVPLTEYAGGTPRIVIFIHNSTVDEVMLADIKVRDGDGPLPGDVFGLGNMREDGWSLGHIYSFVDQVDDWNWYLNPLIDGYGDLTVVDTDILSLPGLERRSSKYYPMADQVDQGDPYDIFRNLPNEGGINVSGELLFSSSRFDYVPIKSLGYWARFSDCSFLGDCRMLSIAETDTTISDCTFEFKAADGLWGPRRVDEETWMVAFEGGSMAPRVRGCSFTGEGEGTGIVVNHGRVELTDCEFAGLDIGVWVHESPVMSWSELSSEISYDDTCTVGYLETTEVLIDMDGENRPSEPDESYSWWDSRWYEEVPGLHMYFDIRIMHTRQLLCMPVLLVGPNMGEHRVGNLSVWVNPNWAPGRTMSIDPNEGYHYVWLDERDGDPGRQWQMFHDERTEMGERAGELETGLYVYSEYASVGDLYINVSVDGEQIDHFKLNETGRNWTADTIDWVTVDTIVPPGPHNLTFTGGINASAWNITWELDERTLQVYRYTGSEDAEELAAWLVSNRYTILMVDPGVRLDGLSCTVGTMDYYFSMSILTWDGSQVVIDELSFQEGAWGQLVTSGNGTYWINNLTAFWIDHEVRNCTVTMGSPDIVVYFPSLNNGDLYICGTFDNSDLFLEAVNGSLFVMDGVDVDMDEYGSLLAIGSDVVLRDCRFVSQHETAIRMNGRVWANFTVDSCEFVGVGLYTDFSDKNCTLLIEDCSFEGPRTFLMLIGDEMLTQSDLDLSDLLPLNGSISGNVFTGEGALMVFFPELRASILGDNVFEEGARAYASYWPDVEYENLIYQDYGFVTMDSLEFYQTSGFDVRYFEDRFGHLLDVTEDPLDETDPGLVPVVLRYRYSSDRVDGPVVGFQHIPIASETVTLRDCYWGSSYDLVADLMRTFSFEDNWWTS